jgi:hypothetical protein
LVNGWARALVLASLFGCGHHDAVVCPQATIMSPCATPARVPCRDAHANTCVVCSGAGVVPQCIYDPSAPFDGGTAVCVAKCTDCGADCSPVN